MQPTTANKSSFDLEEFLGAYRPQPHRFVRDVIGANTWWMQDEIVQSVFRNKITTVKTCNAVGKSFIAARVVVAYLTLFPGSVVVTTAPTWRQVTDILWREIATAVKTSKYKLTNKEVKQAGLDFDKDWYAVGLSTKYPTNFFGYHADHILVVVDEAGGVEEQIFDGVRAITPNVNARILYIGNPTNPGGTFYKSFNPKFPSKKFTISAFDTPNFIQVGIRTLDDLLRIFTPPPGVDPLEHKPYPDDFEWVYPNLISPVVVYQRYLEWGTDSPNWEALVMGQFPTQSDKALFPADLVIKARNMYGIGEYYNPETGKTESASNAKISGWDIPDGPPEYGLDMARYGLDKTVLTPRRGGWVDQQIDWSGKDLIGSAERVLKLIDPIRESPIKIDDTGNGGGTTDALIRFQQQQNRSGGYLYNYQVIPYNFSQAPKNPAKFHDITSEIYWNLAQWFKNHHIAIPDDDELCDELMARRWKLTPAGKIKVESKDEYRERTGGHSPDKSDSLALAFADSISYNAVQQQDISDFEQELQQDYQSNYEPVTSGVRQRY
jgi:phage terminase large subunit